MTMSGVSLSVIGNALNHKDLSTTRKVYAQTAREAEKQARVSAHRLMFPNSGQGGTNVIPLSKYRADDEPEAAGGALEF